MTYEEAFSYQKALAWFAAERPVLLAIVALPPARFDSYTCHQQATVCYQQALDRFRATSDPYGEGTCLRDLGDSLDAVGNTVAARQAWASGLEILNRLDHPDADQVRARLRPVTSLVCG